MIGAHPLGSFLSLLGTLLHVGIVLGMEPADLSQRRSAPRGEFWVGYVLRPAPFSIWAPYMENLGEGRPAFLGRRCPGRQQTGTPFRIDESPLPEGFNPHAFPRSDVVACVRLDPGGVVLEARLVGGTGSAALDRRLLRTLVRQWRFAPVDGTEAMLDWQRIRLNSGRRDMPPPEPGPEWLSL